MPDLERFRMAQDASRAGFASALRELQGGRKTGHWIWYVFPQLAGLGRSSTAVHYGLADADEAAAYLLDPVLGERLVEAAAAVRAHLTGPRAVRLEQLMGSSIDSLKLVSCMTLFERVARALHIAESQRSERAKPSTPVGPRGARTSPPSCVASKAEHAEAILEAAAAQGYGRCSYTEDRLRGWDVSVRP
jgi:uncharacterized protein (DUF1810 family)